MENFTKILIPELLFSTSDKKKSVQQNQWLAQGIIRKIASQIYTSNFIDTDELIIKRNLFFIIGNLFPNAVLSHRSALEFAPTNLGDIYITYSYTKNIVLPGIVIHLIEGSQNIKGDNQLMNDLYVSQMPRALLENLQTARIIKGVCKCLPISKIEEKIESIISIQGEDAINKIRDEAKKIAKELHFIKEFEKLSTIISAMLQTNSSGKLSSPLAQARAYGLPFDNNRIELFETLFTALQTSVFPIYNYGSGNRKNYTNFSFFESYFSNYIEGTIFEIDEAKEIIETNKPIANRNADSHDILATYELVNNIKEMRKTPKTFDELLQLLMYRHQVIMRARLDKEPGIFKTKNNRAGNTLFVDMHLVKGTISRGFQYYQSLQHSFSKAIFMMFLVSEVHPFLDGNGRLARIMMNSELVNNNDCKIIIPTVYREDYLLALRKLSRKKDPNAYIKMMQRAYLFSNTIYNENIQEMEQYLKECNAFEEPSEAALRFNV